MDSPTKQILTRYGMMTVLDHDLGIGRWLEKYGEWAQSEIDLMCSIILPGATFLDIGAFIGTHTVPLARHVGNKGVVYSGEPRPEHFVVLKQNVEQNRLSNVHIMNMAFSNELGEVKLPPIDTKRDYNFGGQGLASPLELNKSTVSIRVTTVDELNLERCDLIKVDVEGMESSVLSGSKKTIAQLRPVIYAECLTMHAAWEIITLMCSAGYTSFIHLAPYFNPNNFLCNSVDISQGGQQTMVLSTPEEKEADVMENIINQQLVPITTIDDMVKAFVKSPSYWNPFGLGIHTDDAYERALQAMRASWSWRLTAPLRAIAGLLNRH